MPYGTAAYTGNAPIGPSEGYVSPLGISEHNAQDWPESVEGLTAALAKSAGSGRLVWIPKGVTITVPNTSYGKTIKSGFILAGPGNIDWNYYGPTSGYMIPLLNMQEGAVLSGPCLTGGGGYGHYGQGAGPCAIRASGQKRIIIENVDLTKFRGGGIWFGDGAASITRWDDDSQRNIVRHCRITHIQQYGFGYGCGLQGARQSFLIEASILGWNRHSTMTSGGTTSAYEVRYCRFEDSVYANSDTGPASIQSHQVDAHGGGWLGQSYRCGKYLWVHHCDFTANDMFSEKPNVCIRGRMADGGWAIIEKCRTLKRHGSDPPGAYTDMETAGNGYICMLAEEEGAPWKGPKAFSSAGVIVRDNWYGAEDPPDDDPPINVNTADIRVTDLETSPVAVGETYKVTATVQNVGDGPGSADIVIGYFSGSTKHPLLTQLVELEAGESAVVTRQATATTAGVWTFYCGDLTVVLTVLEELPSLTVTTQVIEWRTA